MNKQESIVRISKEKGYFVDEFGTLFNSEGKKISLSKSNKGTGYLSFNIRVDKSKPTRSFVHKLQAFQKFGEKLFEKGVVVRHLDGDSTNNSYDNIALGSAFDNAQDIPKEKRVQNASHPIYNHQVIIDDRNNGLTYAEIMKKHGIKSKSTVSFILNNSLSTKKK
jgi:hypothetical protein